MADNLGPMAWLFLQENVQVQYLQKIALRAENKLGQRMGIDQLYFLRQQFSAAIEAAHFPACGTAIDACAAAIFTLHLKPVVALLKILSKYMVASLKI